MATKQPTKSDKTKMATKAEATTPDFGHHVRTALLQPRRPDTRT